MENTIKNNVPSQASIENNFRFAERIKNLDERTGLKIALALAAHDRELFQALYEYCRTANLLPAPKTSPPIFGGRVGPWPPVNADLVEPK
jgi:hypothetical protein